MNEWINQSIKLLNWCLVTTFSNRFDGAKLKEEMKKNGKQNIHGPIKLDVILHTQNCLTA